MLAMIAGGAGKNEQEERSRVEQRLSDFYFLATQQSKEEINAMAITDRSIKPQKKKLQHCRCRLVATKICCSRFVMLRHFCGDCIFLVCFENGRNVLFRVVVEGALVKVSRWRIINLTGLEQKALNQIFHHHLSDGHF
jgi:hypothetical protein